MPAEISALLHHQPLFQSLSAEQLAALLPDVQEMHLAKGDVLFRRGDACDGLFVVVFGRIKLSMFSTRGDEKVVEIIPPGQSFAEAVMFLGYPYPLMAQCLEDSYLLKVGARGILEALDHDPAFARRMLAGLSMRLHGLMRDVERYSTENALQRVCGYLLHDAPATEGDAPVVTLPVNKNLIASRLNLTPETLSRILHRLGAAALIAVNGRHITLCNPEGLRILANNAE